MRSRRRDNRGRKARCTIITTALAVVVSATAIAQQPPSVAAEFVSFVSPPGATEHFERPSAIHVDSAHAEMLVADAGRNRVVIFDTDGHYRFEFTLGDHAAMPVDLAVDSHGFIYVVASTRTGRRLVRFDFDGAYLGEIDLPLLADGNPIAVDDVAIDGRDRLVLVDRDGIRIRICEADGSLVRSFDLAPDASTNERRELVLGRLTVTDERIYVPFSSHGTVEVYDLHGRRIGFHGYKGSNPGELAFPVAVAVAGDLVAVLDKHRFNVVCYDVDGRFLGEFGGKGISPGWFYHPTLLGAGPDDQVYVGQIFENKIQICRIPEFIVNRLADPAAGTSPQGS